MLMAEKALVGGIHFMRANDFFTIHIHIDRGLRIMPE
jgi:hypothetical protein